MLKKLLLQLQISRRKISDCHYAQQRSAGRMIQTAMTEFARLNPDDRTVAPMSVCGAMSEGYIGYDLQNAIREELLKPRHL